MNQPFHPSPDTFLPGAIYLRLSKDDEANGESMSIANQRKLLLKYARDHHFSIEKDTYFPMFITVLYTTAKTWKEPQCPVINEWIKKMWYIYTMEYYSAIKKISKFHLQQHGCN